MWEDIVALWTDIVGQLEEPFVGDVSLGRLFFLVGAVLLIIALWGVILHFLQKAAKAV